MSTVVFAISTVVRRYSGHAASRNWMPEMCRRCLRSLCKLQGRGESGKGAGNAGSLHCDNHCQSPARLFGCDNAFRATKVRRIWALVGQANWISAVFRQMGLWQLSLLSSSWSVRVVLRNILAFCRSSFALALTVAAMGSGA